MWRIHRKSVDREELQWSAFRPAGDRRDSPSMSSTPPRSPLKLGRHDPERVAGFVGTLAAAIHVAEADTRPRDLKRLALRPWTPGYGMRCWWVRFSGLALGLEWVFVERGSASSGASRKRPGPGFSKWSTGDLTG